MALMCRTLGMFNGVSCTSEENRRTRTQVEEELLAGWQKKKMTIKISSKVYFIENNCIYNRLQVIITLN